MQGMERLVTTPRSVRRVLLALALCAAMLSCTGPGRARNELEGTRIWVQYQKLDDYRAMAVAGDPERVWVAGLAGSQPDQATADAEAMEECLRQRTKRRMKAPCRPYASGSRVVWMR